MHLCLHTDLWAVLTNLRDAAYEPTSALKMFFFNGACMSDLKAELMKLLQNLVRW